MAVAEPHKAAKTHDNIGDTTGHLVDDEVIDLTDFLAIGAIDLGPVDVLARNALMIRMSSCASHGISSFGNMRLFP